MAHPDDFAEAAANMCEMERGWGGKGDVVAWLRRQCTYVAERRADSLKRKPSKAANGFKQPAPQHTEAQKAEFVAAASYTDARMEQWEKSFQRERCALWDKVTASLMRDSERSWDMRQFLTPMGILAIDETRHRLRLIGPDETHETYVSEHYGRAILAALQEHTGASWEVHYGPRLAAVAEPKPLRVLDMASGASA